MSTSDTINSLTNSSLAKCPTLRGRDNYTEWEGIMRLNLQISGCWDIISGKERAPSRPNPFYTSYNKPCGIKTLRQAESDYAQCDEAGNFIHSDDSCKDRVQEIKDQVTGYETYTRLREKAKNLIMDSMTKNLWHQRVNKDDPSALWQELRNDYKAGVAELGKELTKYANMSRSTYPNPQTLLNALEKQHSKIETFKARVFHPEYLSWRYTYEMNKFKPLFDIPLAEYNTLSEYPPPDDVKRALEAHLVNHSKPQGRHAGKSRRKATGTARGKATKTARRKATKMAREKAAMMAREKSRKDGT